MTEDNGIDWEKIKEKKPWEYQNRAFDLAKKGPEYFEKTIIEDGEVKKREYVRWAERQGIDHSIRETPVTFTDDNASVWQWDKSDASPFRDNKYRKVRP